MVLWWIDPESPGIHHDHHFESTLAIHHADCSHPASESATKGEFSSRQEVPRAPPHHLRQLLHERISVR